MSEHSMYVLIENEMWLGMGGGDDTDLLRRLDLPEVPGVEIGPSIFRLFKEGAFVELELRHPDFRDGQWRMLDQAREVLAGMERHDA